MPPDPPSRKGPLAPYQLVDDQFSNIAWLGVNPVMDWHPIQRGGGERGSRTTPTHFMLQKLAIHVMLLTF